MTRSMDLRPGRVAPIAAFTMVETLMCILLVGGLLCVALNTVGATTVGQQNTAERGHAQLLAAALMSEIMQQSYADPDPSPVFGREPLEIGLSRALFDDVDDYDAYSDSPPQHKNGTEMSDQEGWTRTVAVEFVRPSDLLTAVGLEYGVKRITVTVGRVGDNGEIASMVAVKTGGMAAPGKKPVRPTEPLPWLREVL